MNQATVYQTILDGLKNPAIPVHVRLTDQITHEQVARILTTLIGAKIPKPPLIQPTFAAMTAAKYDED